MRILVAVVLAAVTCAAPEASATMADAQLAEIARNTPEGREFYTKFPGAQATVDRSGRLAVDLRSGSARLRFFVVNGSAVEPFLDCPVGTIRTTDVLLAIRACG